MKEDGRSQRGKEGLAGKKQELLVDKAVVLEMKRIPLPQRRIGGRGGGGCVMMPRNIYGNLSDEKLPWQRQDFEEILESPDLSEGVRQSLIDLFGRTIIALRKGQSISIAIGKSENLQK